MIYEQGSKFHSKMDIFSKKIWIVPANVGENHWLVAIIHFDQGKITVYILDSLGKRESLVSEILRVYIEELLVFRKISVDFTRNLHTLSRTSRNKRMVIIVDHMH